MDMENQLLYIKHSNIDFVKWDKTVNTSAYPSIFANSFFLNSTSPGWDALVIGDYESVFPLTIKSKYRYTYLPQPLFTGQLGLFGKTNASIETLILDYLRSNYKLIEIELNANNHPKTEGIGLSKTHIINYNTVWEYNQNTKRNIKKAQTLGLKVEKAILPEILILSKKYLNPFLKEELGISREGLFLFNQLLEEAIKLNYLVTFKVIDEHKKIRALGHFIFNKYYALYLKGTNLDKKENSGSMHLLMDTAIHYFGDKSKLFDFGGGSKTGIANFFTGLGGKPLEYPTFKVNKLPYIVKLIKNKR